MSDLPTWRITLSDVDCDAAQIEAVAAVLRDGWLSMGPRVAAFERAFAVQHDVPHAVALSSGTAALHLALLALDIGPGDEVIQPAINFVAAANMTRAVGATPRFADIQSPAVPMLDVAAVQRLINPHTRAIIVLHYGGYPAPIDALARLARRHGIALIEDACHAPATPAGGRPLGTWGAAGCFSFFPNKNMTTGEGGMLVTHCPRIAERVRTLRSHGMTTLTWDRHRGHASSYDVCSVGFNYRLDEMRAALGLAQLERLAQANRRRQELTAQYRRRLAGAQDLAVVCGAHDGPHAGHLFAVLVAPEIRDHVARTFRNARIQTSLHYPCITTLSAHRWCDDEVPHSLAFASQALTLPLHPGLRHADVETICGILCDALSGALAPR